MSIKSKIAYLFILSLVMVVTSCGFDRYNVVTDDTADVRENSKYVYGESKEAAPRQAAQTYAADPEAERKAIDLRKKMFEDGTNTLATQNAAPAVSQPDTTQAVQDSTSTN